MTCARNEIVISLALLAVPGLAGAGCETVEHRWSSAGDFGRPPGSRVEVGAVLNATGEGFDFNVEPILRDELRRALGERGLLWSEGETGEALLLETRIRSYQEGSAVMRWTLPFWGTTELSVRGTVREKKTGETAGSVEALRRITWGGAVDAWREILGSVADDVAAELKENLSP